MLNMVPNRPAGAWNFGAGGVTDRDNINWLDASNALTALYRQKVAASEQAWRNGLIQNPNEMQSLRDSLSRWENIQANHGVTPQMFSLPQYSVDNFFTEANEASRLPGQGGQVRYDAVEQVLPDILRGRNQGQLMRPWTATGLVDSNFGSGSEGNYVAGGIARYGYNTAPTDPNRPSAFGSYGGGSGWNPQGGSVLGGPGGRIPYGQPYGSSGNTRTFNSWSGPGGFNTSSATGATTSQPSPLWSEPRGSSPQIQYDENGRAPRPGGGYIQNTPNGPYEVDRFGNRLSSGMQSSTFGAMAMPYGGPSTVDYRRQPDFTPQYMGPYSQAYYNNAMNAAAIYGGLLGSGRGYSSSPGSYAQPGQGVFMNDFNRRGY